MSYDLGPALLFCPADRPERYAKALGRADGVILDLEDAVVPSAKDEARETVRAAATGLDLTRTVVRVNPAGSPWFAADVAMVRDAGYRWVMLPKAEAAADLAALAGLRVIALAETARGVLAAGELAASGQVEAMFWGAEDLVASLGGTSSRGADGTYRPVVGQARATVALAAAAHRTAMLDAVFLDLADLDGLRAEAEDAAALGFAGTVCLHPAQVPVVRAAYTPSAEALDRARRLLAAAEGQRGAFAFEGQMADEVHLSHARRLLSRSPSSAPPPAYGWVPPEDGASSPADPSPQERP